MIEWLGDDWSELGPMQIVLGLLLAAGAVAAFLRWGLDLGADFVIRGDRHGRVRVKGRIPAGKIAAIREFFTRDLPDLGGFTVRGSFGPKRSLKLRYSPAIGPGQRQRVRNFLVDLFR